MRLLITFFLSLVLSSTSFGVSQKELCIQAFNEAFPYQEGVVQKWIKKDGLPEAITVDDPSDDSEYQVNIDANFNWLTSKQDEFYRIAEDYEKILRLAIRSRNDISNALNDIASLRQRLEKKSLEITTYEFRFEGLARTFIKHASYNTSLIKGYHKYMVDNRCSSLSPKLKESVVALERVWTDLESWLTDAELSRVYAIVSESIRARFVDVLNRAAIEKVEVKGRQASISDLKALLEDLEEAMLADKLTDDVATLRHKYVAQLNFRDQIDKYFLYLKPKVQLNTGLEEVEKLVEDIDQSKLGSFQKTMLKRTTTQVSSIINRYIRDLEKNGRGGQEQRRISRLKSLKASSTSKVCIDTIDSFEQQKKNRISISAEEAMFESLVLVCEGV